MRWRCNSLILLVVDGLQIKLLLIKDLSATSIPQEANFRSSNDLNKLVSTEKREAAPKGHDVHALRLGAIVQANAPDHGPDFR